MSAKRSVKDASQAKKASGERGRGRGRLIVALVLVLFVCIAAAVIWRRSHGITIATEVYDLSRKKEQLEAERKQLEATIRDESSRSRLMPSVQAMGMRVPSDAQVRILVR